ncbi:MAG: SDR family oxidoreductase [Actinobacteria bacterium]|nr:SDR family oxidoreductase [Actinomycetota bacterium]
MTEGGRWDPLTDCGDKVVLVVGGTRGIGHAAASALAAAGATVAVTGRRREAAEAVARELGPEALGIELDVGDPEQSKAAAARVLDRHGRLDGLVANAGIASAFVRPEDLTPDQWDATLTVNLRGIFFAIQAAARAMLDGGGGSIVTVSSVVARIATLRTSAYAASKGGVESLTISLAGEWARSGIRVNGVAPGYVETELTDGLRNSRRLGAAVLGRTPLGRYAQPAEIGGLIAFLISDSASYITGQTFAVDGGMTAA